MSNVAQKNAVCPSAANERLQASVSDLHGLLNEASEHIEKVVMLHHYIDGMRILDEVSPSAEMLDRFSVAASLAIGAVDVAKRHLDELAREARGVLVGIPSAVGDGPSDDAQHAIDAAAEE